MTLVRDVAFAEPQVLSFDPEFAEQVRTRLGYAVPSTRSPEAHEGEGKKVLSMEHTSREAR